MEPKDAVVAGSAAFVDAVLPMFTERLGGAPRVADSPPLATALCQDGARVLVYEHGGQEWLPLCAEARALAGPGLVLVAALPPEHAADVAAISSAASAVVAWRGDARPVLDAVARVIAARQAPRAARPPGPVLTPQPSRSDVRPALTPSGPRPAMPGPVLTPAPGRAAARPALTPSGPRPAVQGPVLTPSPQRATPAPATPAPVGAAPRAAPVPAAAARSADPFDGIFDEGGDGLPSAGHVPAAAPVAPLPAPMPVSQGHWPSTVLAASDGLGIVRAALAGLWPEQRFHATTERVVAALSPAERAAAHDQKLPFDPEPVRRAVGLRWQVAAALDSLPAQGSPVDQASVQAILGGIDDVLASLKVLSDDASPEALRALEGVRHALVKEAIDLTEALQSVAPAQVVEEITSSRKAKRAEVAQATRVVFTPVEVGSERRSVPWGLVIVLVLVVAAAAGYHGWRYVNRPGPVASPVGGAPAGTLGALGKKEKLVVSPDGKGLDPKELENFRSLEKAKGNEVREVLPGTYVVTPESARVDKGTDPAKGSPQGAKP